MSIATPSISVVIPVYRSAPMLPELCARLHAVLQPLTPGYELVLVNDASPDDSWQVLCDLHARDPRIKALNLTRNFGQHAALLCGLAHAQGDLLITMDDDLQHPPEEVPVLVRALQDTPAADAIIGAYTVKQHSWLRNLGTAVIHWATTRAFRKDPRLRLTSFRILRRSLVGPLLQFGGDSPRVGQMLLMTTSRIRNVPVRHAPRAQGRSGYTFARLCKDFLDNVLSNSTLPLSFVIYLGFGSAALSFLLSALIVYKKFMRGISVPGWATIMVVLLFMFGMVFVSLGIIGEYLIRILREAKKHPQYIVREALL